MTPFHLRPPPRDWPKRAVILPATGQLSRPRTFSNACPPVGGRSLIARRRSAISFSSAAASRFSFAMESLRFLIWAFIALSARLRSSRAASTAESCCRLSDSRAASRSRSAASAAASSSIFADDALDLGDLRGAGAAEIRVVHQHAAEGRGILLRQQHLELLLPPADVGAAQFRGQHVALLAQRRLVPLALRGQALQRRVALGEALADVAEFRARAAHVLLGVAQLAREGVALVRVAAHRALQRLDALAHLAQLLLGVGLAAGAGTPACARIAARSAAETCRESFN